MLIKICNAYKKKPRVYIQFHSRKFLSNEFISLYIFEDKKELEEYIQLQTAVTGRASTYLLIDASRACCYVRMVHQNVRLQVP